MWGEGKGNMMLREQTSGVWLVQTMELSGIMSNSYAVVLICILGLNFTFLCFKVMNIIKKYNGK